MKVRNEHLLLPFYNTINLVVAHQTLWTLRWTLCYPQSGAAVLCVEFHRKQEEDDWEKENRRKGGMEKWKKQSISVFLSFWFKSLTSIILSWLFFTVLWTSIEQTKSADFRDVASACSTCCLVYPLKRNQRVPLDISVHYLHKRTFFFWLDDLIFLTCYLLFSFFSAFFIFLTFPPPWGCQKQIFLKL